MLSDWSHAVTPTSAIIGKVVISTTKRDNLLPQL